MAHDHIAIRGARTHNLKNIDLDIPRDKFVVITGLSGSGKSTIANLLEKITEKRAFFILTNAAHESIEKLFSNLGKKHKVQRSSNIGGKGASRKKVNEYIFTNI